MPQVKRKMMSTWGLAALAVVSALLAPAQAGNTVAFDPTGGGGANPDTTINASGFSYFPGNAIAIGAVTPGMGPQVGTTFELRYQAVLSGISGMTQSGGDVGVFGNGNINFDAPPAFTGKEVTVVADFKEVITGKTVQGGNNVFTFGLAGGGPNFFQLYSNAAGSANNYTGAGFQAGTLILSGTVIQSSSEGSYTSSIAIPNSGPGSPTSPVLFDQFSGDGAPGSGGKYPGIQTLSGSGSTFLPVLVNYTNSAYFPAPSTFIMNVNLPSISAAVPFTNVSPSKNFFGYTPNIGTINQFNGHDAQFQAQAANDFTSAVPEPSTIFSALTAIVLIPGFVLNRRRQTKANAA